MGLGVDGTQPGTRVNFKKCQWVPEFDTLSGHRCLTAPKSFNPTGIRQSKSSFGNRIWRGYQDVHRILALVGGSKHFQFSTYLYLTFATWSIDRLLPMLS